MRFRILDIVEGQNYNGLERRRERNIQERGNEVVGKRECATTAKRNLH